MLLWKDRECQVGVGMTEGQKVSGIEERVRKLENREEHRGEYFWQ